MTAPELDTDAVLAASDIISHTLFEHDLFTDPRWAQWLEDRLMLWSAALSHKKYLAHHRFIAGHKGLDRPNPPAAANQASSKSREAVVHRLNAAPQ